MSVFVRSVGSGAGVLVHGGAGAVDSSRRPSHVEGCLAAARAGFAVIRDGGSALDGAQAAARALEDAPQFNAGTGAALTSDGVVEHDAALMCGETLRAGAVAALRSFKNPIDVARVVLERTHHVMLVGEGAARFAIDGGVVPCDPASLVTQAATDALAKVLAGHAERGWAGGTIGVVARDRAGHLAAATSTGGMVAKLPGRVGDSPILGAGTLADDATCAASATGDGEGILKVGLTRALACALASGEPLERAIERTIVALADRARATGGVIAVDRTGAFAIGRNTATMSWAVATDTREDAGI